MKNTTMFTKTSSGLLILFAFISSCESCREDIIKIKEICDETPSTAYLLPVRSLDYDKLGSKYLVGTSQVVHACEDHFGLAMESGQELTAALAEINRIEGCKLQFTSVRDPHYSKATLFPATPVANYFDYVNNDPSAEPGTIPCHSDGSIACGDWVINTCRYDGSGWSGSNLTTHWVISANSYCYDHYSSSTSDDHPYKHGILHEFAHAFGMEHTSSWDADDLPYISTMEGNLHYLSALDAAYLRYRYPEAMNPHRNYVAGSVSRFLKSDGSYEKLVFWDNNPQSLYADASGELKDCSTQNDPEFFVSWFNTGDLDGDSKICGVNRIYLRESGTTGSEGITLLIWKIATMPYLSQDQWRGTIHAEKTEISKIDFSKTYDLVFQVNAWKTMEELTDTDNELSYPISLYSGSCH